MSADPSVLEALRTAAAYPEDASAVRGVEHVETHISHVFLTAERVYKFRKAVAFGFLDFSSLARRNADCLREVSLNRRLAPDVYLGVAPLVTTGGRARVGAVAEGPGAGEDEHCVVMRRLPRGLDAESRLQEGSLLPAQLDAFATALGRFHTAHRLPRRDVPDADRFFARVASPAEANWEALQGRVPEPDRLRVQRAGRSGLQRAAPWLEKRRRLGLLADGHGDLRLEHVWFEPGRTPVAIDCIEFDAALRQTDPANDIGFFLMDCLRHGGRREAQRFVQGYLWETDDFSSLAVVNDFAAYAACVRAKVEGLAGAARGECPAEGLLALASEILEPGRVPTVYVLCGVVGTGKSTLASAVAETTGGVIVASDRVRQRYSELWGVRGAVQYRPEWKRAVYDGVLARAGPVVESGRDVILDATFSRSARRAQARRWAQARDCRVVLLEARCDRAIALARLAQREERGEDPSEAGPEQYEASVAAFEAVVVEGGCEHRVVDTGRDGWRTELARTLR